MGLIDVYRINPADSFSVKSASLKKQQDITYFTLLAKIRGDLNLTSIDSNVDNWNSAYDNVVVSGNVTGYNTKTINLVRRDGSVVSFSFEDLNSPEIDTLDMVTTRGNVTVNTIDVGGVLTPWVDLDTSYSNGNVIGRLSWDQDNATMDVGLNSNTILKVGQDDLWYVKNQTGSTITKGTVVMAVGTLGASGRILVSPMVSNGSVSPKYILGITAEAIPNGSDGYVLAKGKLRQIDTSAYTNGQVLWCSPTVPGALTATEPQAPNLKLPIAFVVNAAANGTLAIRTTTGSTLSENHQVQFGTLANNDVLTYSTFAGRWQNTPIGNIAATLAFRTIAVTGSSSIVADSSADTLTVTAGSGITLAGNATTDTLTITNSAPDQVVSLTAGTGISTSGVYPSFTITNTAPDQVVSITGAGTSVVTGSYPSFTVTSNDQYVGTVTSVGITAGTGISVSGSPITSSGSITVTNNDKGSDQNIFKTIKVTGQSAINATSNNSDFSLVPSTGLSITTNPSLSTITLTNTDTGSAQNIFKNIAVSGQTTVVADSNNDTLTLVAGTNITITTDATTDSITIDATIPPQATPADATYQRDYASPFVIPSSWAVVSLNSFDIRVSVNKTPADDNRAYFFVTFEVESTDTSPQFRMFKYKLYNATLAVDVTDSESYWVGYMYGTSEVPYTTFSFHIPSNDGSITSGDNIELQVQELSTGTAPNITYAALSYIDAVG